MNSQNIISNKFDLFWTTSFSYMKQDGSSRPLQNLDIKLLHAKKQQAEMRRNQGRISLNFYARKLRPQYHSFCNNQRRGHSVQASMHAKLCWANPVRSLILFQVTFLVGNGLGTQELSQGRGKVTNLGKWKGTTLGEVKGEGVEGERKVRLSQISKVLLSRWGKEPS